MYAVFTTDGNLKGLIPNKKQVPLFLKERKGFRYKIIKVEKETIQSMKDRGIFVENHTLDVTGNYAKLVFGYEVEQASKIVDERVFAIHDLNNRLSALIPYVKLKDSQLFEVAKLIEFLDEMIGDLTLDETCVMVEDYFNMDMALDEIIKLDITPSKPIDIRTI